MQLAHARSVFDQFGWEVGYGQVPSQGRDRQKAGGWGIDVRIGPIDEGMVMNLNKTTVAKVAALILEGVSSEEFTRHAEKNLPYRLSDGTCLYVIGRGDRKVPIPELTDLTYSPMLFLVLPYDAVSVRTLPTLWLIDVGRGYSAFVTAGGSYNCNIILVGDVGRDSFTRQVKYGIIRFPSTAALLSAVDEQVGNENKRHLMEVWAKHPWDGSIGLGATRRCNAYIRGALKAKLVRSPNTQVTLPAKGRD